MPYGEGVRSEVGEKEALCPFGSSPLMTDGSMDHLPDSSSPSGIVPGFQDAQLCSVCVLCMEWGARNLTS